MLRANRLTFYTQNCLSTDIQAQKALKKQEKNKKLSWLSLALTFLNSGDAPSPSAHVQVWCHLQQSHHTCNYVMDNNQMKPQVLTQQKQPNV